MRPAELELFAQIQTDFLKNLQKNRIDSVSLDKAIALSTLYTNVLKEMKETGQEFTANTYTEFLAEMKTQLNSVFLEPKPRVLTERPTHLHDDPDLFPEG